MFLLNSRYPLVTAARRGYSSYGITSSGTPSSEVTVLICRVPSGWFSHTPWDALPAYLCQFPVRSPAHPTRSFSWKHGISHLLSSHRGSTHPHHPSVVTTPRLCHTTPTAPTYRLELPSIRQLTYPSPSLQVALCPWRFRNINLIPITYAFRPRLRDRLTLSGISLLEETLGLRRPGFSPGFSLLMSA